MLACLFLTCTVSTHSRLKAAGDGRKNQSESVGCFNTQPPEGGWAQHPRLIDVHLSFNTQPPEGGWDIDRKREIAASILSFNTQPPEGGWEPLSKALLHQVSQPRFR